MDLQDIANDYRASIQEMETARLDAENEASYGPPPWESQPDEMGVIDITTMKTQQDPQMREMIATAEEEVRSLRSSSSVYSDSTASIYSSLSRHSMRMSVVVDQLPMAEVLNASEQRKSVALTLRNSNWVQSTVPSSSVPEVQIQRPPELVIHRQQPEVLSLSREDLEKAFKELCTFPICML